MARVNTPCASGFCRIGSRILNITVPEVIRAVQAQNNVNPAGQIGGEPVPQGQVFTFSVNTTGRLVTPQDFENIVIRANSDGSIVRVKEWHGLIWGPRFTIFKGVSTGRTPPFWLSTNSLARMRWMS